MFGFEKYKSGTVYLNVDWDQFLKIQQMRLIDDIFIVADNGEVFLTDIKEHNLLLLKNYKLNLFSNWDKNWKKALEVWKRAKNFKGRLYPTIEEYAEAKSQHLVVKTEMEIHERKNGMIYKEKQEKDPLDWDVSTMKEEKEKKSRQDPSKSEESDILKYKVTFERTRRGRNWQTKVESQDIAKTIEEVLQDKFHWLLDSSMYHKLFMNSTMLN